MNTTPPARLLGLALFLTLAVACAGPPAPPTPAADAPTPTSASSATPTPPSATPRPAPSHTPTPAPRPLRLWVGEADAALDAVRALIADYQRSGGGPITVVAHNPDTLRMSVAGAALTGDPPPDLIWADQETLAGLLADGQLQPIQAAGDPLPGLLEDATAQGALWGLPLTAQGGLLLLYNQQLAAGPPATSDELITRSRAGKAGLVMAWDEPRWLLPWLHGFGGAVTDATGDTPTLDSPAMLSALGLLRELAVASPPEVKTYRGGQRWFGAGEVAFAVDGDWALPEYRTLTETLDLGVAQMPLVPATGRRALPIIGGTFLMLQRDLAGADLGRALSFAAFLERPETQAGLARALGRLPASREALADPAIRADPALAAAAAMAAQAPGLPPTKAARCALFGVDVWLPSLLRGTLDQAEATSNMQREAEACVTR
ncbi:extracellular solute-binding protein [Oscillochloris sp. ZM17-4]|uniref:sugar ABC transporter substrate-binding protein n=1 Tax=Oscillochloris sp. ZM17-4 TaxID=2866714 RepID=UPI001C73CCF4|nr:extracellular solute-binding protein [Oscillochloris sp. ZM17-4]MBX0330581.1 extracellular solute-binding protein [Oscillochloris sp. ZM17-4]